MVMDYLNTYYTLPYMVFISVYMAFQNVGIPATNCKRTHENIHNPMYMMKW